MGYDSECDLVIESEDDPAVAKRIAHIRDDLLAEHLDLPEDAVRDALADGGSMIALVDRVSATNGRRLVPLPMRELSQDEEMLAESNLADPLRPGRLKRTFRKLLG
jgi:phospholipase D1/2